MLRRSVAVLISASLLLASFRAEALASVVVRAAPAAAPAGAPGAVHLPTTGVQPGAGSVSLGVNPALGLQVLPSLTPVSVQTTAPGALLAPPAAIKTLSAASPAAIKTPAAIPTRKTAPSARGVSAASPALSLPDTAKNSAAPRAAAASLRGVGRTISEARTAPKRAGIKGTLDRAFDGLFGSKRTGSATPAAATPRWSFTGSGLRRAAQVRASSLESETPLPNAPAGRSHPKASRTTPEVLAFSAAVLGVGLDLVLPMTAPALGMWLGHQINRAISNHAETEPSIGKKLLTLALTSGIATGAVLAAYMIAPWAAYTVMAGLAIAAIILGRSNSLHIDDYLEGNLDKLDGDTLFDLRRVDDQLIMRLREDQLEKPFLMTATVERGVGEKWLYSMSPLDSGIVYLRRSGNQIQLVRKNTKFRAEKGSAETLAVKRSFSDSVLAAVPILKQRGKKGKRVWSIDINGFFLEDIARAGDLLHSAYPESEYLLDPELSVVKSARAYPKNVELETELSFYGALPQESAPVPDARNLAMTMRYSLAALPSEGYAPRHFDPRVGYQHEVYRKFSNLHRMGPHDDAYVRMIQKWRLEKTDPKAELSPVKKPIVWWLDHTIPREHRQAVRDGVLLWNKAFERLGFKNVMVVRDAPEPGAKPKDKLEAEFDPADARYNVIRWFAGTDAGVAYAINLIDPRTGEIFKSGIDFSLEMLESGWYQGIKELMKGHEKAHPKGHACQAHKEAARALAALKTGTLTPEEHARFVSDIVTRFIVHEVGHTLGLEHNFAASKFRTLDEIEAAEDGVITHSVMDYTPYNFPAEESPGAALTQTDLGPYDYLAIAYGYTPLEGLNGDEKRAALRKIASRVGEPGYEYAGDAQDNGMDPYVTTFDLGPEPLEYAERTIARAEKALENLGLRPLKEGESYHTLLNDFLNIFWAYMIQSIGLVIPYVGGIHFRHVRAGENLDKTPYDSIPAAKQRAALELIGKKLFSDKPFDLSPEFLSSLGADMRGTIDNDGYPTLSHMPFAAMLTEARVWALQALLHPARLRRISETHYLAKDKAKPLTIPALFEKLRQTIWTEFLWKGSSEGRPFRNASPARRELQAQHLEMLLEMFAYPGTFAERQDTDEALPADAAAASHTELKRLLWHLRRAAKAKGLDNANKNHLKLLIWKIRNALDSK